MSLLFWFKLKELLRDMFKKQSYNIFVISFALMFLPVLSWASSNSVEKVRLGQHDEMTRVVLESNKAIKPKFFHLQSPPRFVLDFERTDFKLDISHMDLPDNGMVKGLREGLFKPKVTRMVVDLKKAAVARVFNIPASKNKGHRLVIDLKPASDAQVAKQKKEFNKLQAENRKQQIEEIFEVIDKKSEEVIVVLDPGHGGVDPGAIGKGKTYEKNVVLQIAKKLKKELEGRENVKVYLTRDRDIFVPLKDRVAIAQRKKADLFISIHADAHNDRRIKGGSIYVLSDRASDREAARLARHANDGDAVAGFDMSHETRDVQNILIDLTQRETKNKSVMLANDILSHMKRNIDVKRDNVSFAGFRVLKAPEIPSVLVEVTYLSNTSEERKLKRRDHQERIARTIAQGVNRFIDQNRLN
ncbi:MAG: N-acetylmuramoyl-L-alanine amidase [Magnetococcales bacterium]|nr:N-acetylmuramoyl-L-alanine amidase [Magnetococcales bacterium]